MNNFNVLLCWEKKAKLMDERKMTNIFDIVINLVCTSIYMFCYQHKIICKLACEKKKFRRTLNISKQQKKLIFLFLFVCIMFRGHILCKLCFNVLFLLQYLITKQSNKLKDFIFLLMMRNIK